MTTKVTMQAQNLPIAANSTTKTYQPEETLIFNYSNNQENVENTEIQTDKNTEEDGGFFNAIKNFFKSIGDFFGKLFGKKDDKKSETNEEGETHKEAEPVKPNNNEEISIDINEKIEDFSQGDLGDCWFLSAIETLSCTEKGAGIIENAIEKNDDNSYSVTFEGLKTSYTITEDELTEAKKEGRVAKGDDDVVLLELAADKALKDVKTNPDKFSDNDYAMYISFLSADPKDNKSFGYVSAGANMDVAAAMFGLDPLNNSGQINVALDGSDFATSDKIDEIKNLDLDNMMTEIVFNTDFLEPIKGADGSNIATTGMHSYSIKSIEDNIITVTNPWNTAYEAKYNLDDIADEILQVNYCSLD